MGTAGRGRVLEFWLLGPDVVVEPGEKLADTRAAEADTRQRNHDSSSSSSSILVCVCCLTLAVVHAVDGVVVGGGPGLVEGGAAVAEGGVWRIIVVYAGVPGVGVVGLLHLDWKPHRRRAVTLTHI